MAGREPSLTILKRTQGKSEPYDEQKLYASIKAVCLKDKQEVTSLDVRAHAYPLVLKLSPKAAAIYKRHHRIMA
jgi:hypothetical protein